jgi:beta-lactamase regulating signal transducer with metallopeptidase domain
MNTATQQFAQNLIVGGLNSLPAGIALALLTWILLRFVRHASSSARFAVWFSALLWLPTSGLFCATGTGNWSAASTAINIPASWAVPVAVIWATLAAAILMRIAIGLSHIRSIRHSCVPVSLEKLSPDLLQLITRSISRNVEISASKLVQVPVAIGFFRPAVVLPEWALTDLSPAQLAAIISHELAHLRRWDDWSNLAQKLLRAVFFFHPAIWWMDRELSLEREMACDDAALAHAPSARDYAQSLVVVAEKSVVKRGVLLAQAIVHRAHETSLRIARILKLTGRGKQSTWKPAVTITAAVSVVMFVVEPGIPRLIAFQNAAPTIIANKTPLLPAVTATEPAANPGYRVVPASVRESAPKLVQTNYKAPVRTARSRPVVNSSRPAQEMLVVFQSEWLDQQGAATWNVYVVRVKWTEKAPVSKTEPSKRT